MIRNKLQLGVLVFMLLLPVSNELWSQAREPTSKDSDFSRLLALNTPNLLEEAGGKSSGLGLQPANLLRTAKDHTYLLWVELKAGMLHLLVREENGSYARLESHPISIGKQGYGKEVEGDQRTPMGVYTITSFLPDDELVDKYGSGAFPLDYPNVIDRLADRTGYGIWLHGLPKGVDSRPKLDSDGCVVIANQTLESLSRYIEIGKTKMILSESLDWVTPSAVNPIRQNIEARIENWRNAWSSIDNDSYLDFYSKEFTNFDQNYQNWETYKRRIHEAKSWIEVDVANLDLIRYPQQDNLVLAEFFQTYKSSNFSAQGLKQQLWKREADGVWRIIYEGGGG